MNSKIRKIEEKIGYSFSNHELFINAMTHSSYSNEKKAKFHVDNERLEFLGDSVLSIVVSEYLYKNYPKKLEGELTKARSKLVCESTLSNCAREIGIGEAVILGKGEELTGGRNRSSILADAFEALLAAIYLDSGFEEAKLFVLSQLSKYMDDAINGKIIQDYKTYLQEVVQLTKGNILEYILSGSKGPDHSKTFFVDVCLNGKVIGSGKGNSKKEAEQVAAKAAISYFEIDGE